MKADNEKPAEKPNPSSTGPMPTVQPLQRPERRLTVLLVVTAITLGFAGSTIGAFALANLSGVPADLGLQLFPSHPYLQVYGFIAEFIIGVAYSLLPRFKAGRLPSVSLGYLVYGTITSANILFILSVIIGYEQLLDTSASLLILTGSLLYMYQVIELVRRPTGGFPEANPLIILSSVSLALTSILLLLELEGLAGTGDVFSPELVYLALLGFAGSEIYAVQVRSVSFRQCDYRKGVVKLASILQIFAVAFTFVASVLPVWVVSVFGGLLFLAAALSVLFSIKVLELAHPLMLRPAMTKMHYKIMRYNEVCILSAAGWLLLGCVVGIIWWGSGTDTFLVKDSFIHSIAIGFIGSSITCFAPMLLPGLLGRKGPVTGLSLGPIALLDVGVVVRIAGNSQTLTTVSLPVWESLSGPLVIVAMVWFLIMLRGIGRKPLQPAIQPKPAVPEHFTLDSVKNAIEIRLAVVGRKTSREISLTVWFVEKDGAVYLLPAQGQSTQWYRNVLKNPKVKLTNGGHSFTGTAEPILDTGRIHHVIGQFRDKYSDRNYRNFYADRVNVAVKVVLA